MLDPDTLERLKSLEASLPAPGEDVLAELCRIFSHDAARYRDALLAALSAKDPEGASLAAHALKGASLSVGAVRLAGLCMVLEEAGRRGDLAQIEGEAERLPEEIEAALAGLEEARA